MEYCKIIDTKSRGENGYELWDLTHECGKIETRIKRFWGSRRIHKAPTRVKCNGKAEAELSRVTDSK